MRLLNTLLLVLLAALPATAQRLLTGRITDESGKPMPLVSIHIQRSYTTAQRIITGINGRYTSLEMIPGEYTVTFSAKGYESQRIVAIPIDSDAGKILLDVRLQKSGAWGSSTASHIYKPQAESAPVAVSSLTRVTSDINSGVRGVLLDEKGQPIVNADVVVIKGGVQKGHDMTDYDGNYYIKSLNGGKYEVKFTYLGRSLVISDVKVITDYTTTVNGRIETYPKTKGTIVRWACPSPVIDPEKPGGRSVKTAEMIDKAPVRNTADVHAYSTTVPRSSVRVGTSTTTPREMRALPAAGGEPDPDAFIEKGTTRDRKDAPIAAASGFVSIAPESPAAHAGSLTSGEINDFSKWTLWEDMSMTALKSYRAAWPFRPEQRYTVLVKSRDGSPLCNALVKMSDGSRTIWETTTDNTGKAELWYGMWDTANARPAQLSASVAYADKVYNIASLKPFAEGANILATKLPCLNPAKLDIAFIVDATGSMQDEINYLKAELRDILQKVKDSMPATQVQTGAIFYRDLADAYLTRTSDLTEDFSKTEAFIADNNADGGGDFPEAVDAALEAGLSTLHWRTEATTRLAFLVLDAPPHNDSATVQRMQALAARYAAHGIRLIPVVCSGSDKPTEYLMRALALATNGTYLFLTDHSGIGGSHTAPTTDKYDVEYLNGLIYRVIYQCAYMPPCKDETPIAQHDTTQVQQATDSATTLTWRYFPNPTTGILYIQHTHTSGYLLITDVTGKALLRIPADASGVTTVDMSQYPAGIYAIRYNWAGDHWVSGKFAVVH